METIKYIMYGADITKWLYSQATAGNAEDITQLMDPLSCMIRLALLYFKDEGTKISIHTNKITYQSPTILQGASRWYNGDNRNDLHNLHYPIMLACENYNPRESREIRRIFEYTIKGLMKLKKAYTRNSESNLVAHCLNHYIDIIMEFMRSSVVGIPIPKSNPSLSSSSSSSSNSGSAPRSQSISLSSSANSASPILPDIEEISEMGDRVSEIGANDEESLTISNRPRLRSIYESERRQPESLQINYKTLWMGEEIHIIHELLELGEKKKDHPEKVEYILRAIEDMLEEKDANIRSIIIRISKTI